GVAKYFDLRAGSKTAIVYAYNIEPPLARWWQVTQVLARHFRHFPALVPVHRRLRGLHVDRGPSLNLYKTNDIVIPADQVDFSPAARRAKVARHHHVSQLPQMEVSVFLAPRSNLLVPGPDIPRQY